MRHMPSSAPSAAAPHAASVSVTTNLILFMTRRIAYRRAWVFAHQALKGRADSAALLSPFSASQQLGCWHDRRIQSRGGRLTPRRHRGHNDLYDHSHNWCPRGDRGGRKGSIRCLRKRGGTRNTRSAYEARAE